MYHVLYDVCLTYHVLAQYINLSHWPLSCITCCTTYHVLARSFPHTDLFHVCRTNWDCAAPRALSRPFSSVTMPTTGLKWPKTHVCSGCPWLYCTEAVYLQPPSRQDLTCKHYEDAENHRGVLDTKTAAGYCLRKKQRPSAEAIRASLFKAWNRSEYSLGCFEYSRKRY